MENYDKYKDFLEISELSAGTAEKKYQSYTEQLEAAQNRLAASWEEIAQNAQINEFLTRIADLGTFLVKHLPTILSYVARIGTAFNAYKLPSIFGMMGHSLGIGTAIGVDGTKPKNIKEWFKMRNQKIENYDAQNPFRNFGLDRTNLILEQIKALMPKSTDSTKFQESIIKQQKEGLKVNKEASKNFKEGVVKKNNLPNKSNRKLNNSATAWTIGATAVMTALTTGASHFNFATGELGDQSEASAAASGAHKAVGVLGTVAGGAVGGYFGGPQGAALGASVGSTLGDLLGSVFGALIDQDRDARKERIRVANETLNQVKTIRGSIDSISTVVTNPHSILSYTESQEMHEKAENLRQTLSNKDNASARNALVSSLRGQTYTVNGKEVSIQSYEDLSYLLDNWEALGNDQRSQLFWMMKSTLGQIESGQFAKSNEELTRNISYDRGFQWDWGELFKNLLIPFYINYGAGKFAWDLAEDRFTMPEIMRSILEKNGYSSDILSTDFWSGQVGLDNERITWQEQKRIWEEMRSIYDSNSQQYKDITTVIDSITQRIADLNEYYKSINQTLIQTAILQTKISVGNKEVSLMMANLAQLKIVGKDNIWEAVVEQLQESGGLRGYSVDSAEGRQIIESVIKSNETLYQLFTGQIFTLREAIDAQDVEVLQTFATALGVSVEKLSELKDLYGDIKLSEMLGGLAETRETLNNYVSFFESLTSSTGLTAENLEKIISNYPQLISYLGNEVDLSRQMFSQMQSYKNLYVRQVSSELLTSTAYYSQFTQGLSTEALTQLSNSASFGNAQYMQQILELITMSEADALKEGISAAVLSEIKELYSKMFALTIDDIFGTGAYEKVSEYVSKILDKQIDNLNEQKEALENINKEREYENQLIEAKLKLEDAQQQKKRIWREGVGWVYESDQAAIQKAADELKTVQNQKRISELEESIKQLEWYKERFETIPNNKEFENLESAFKGFEESVGEQLTSTEAILRQITELYNNLGLTVDAATITQNSQEARSSLWDSIFGSKLGNYDIQFDNQGNLISHMGEGSLWDDIKFAEAAMNYYANASGYGYSSNEYKHWERLYNQAIGSYVSGVGNYQELYNISGSDLASNATGEQQDIYAHSDSYEQHRSYEIYNTPNGQKKMSNVPIMEGSKSYRNFENGTINYWTPNVFPMTTDNKTVLRKSDREQTFGSLSNWFATIPSGTVLNQGKNWAVLLKDGLYGGGIYRLDAAAQGSLGLSGGLTMVNEHGTEAIITPSGTLTALPSGTGVVPADVTRSVWQLGELAPSILRALGYPNIMPNSATYNTNSDSLNIGSVVMNVSADEQWDPTQFVRDLKNLASLNKNNKR